MTKSLDYIFSTKKGLHHQVNQDNYLIIDKPEFNLFAVFDGVSSAKDAKDATLLSKKFIQENYHEYINGTVKINQLMYDLNKYLCNSDLKEPYSTYCLVYYDKLNLSIIYSWLGDSRLYAITNQFIEQLTRDDSYSENIITKYLGDKSLNLDDFRQVKNSNQLGHLLLCTDGFYRVLESNKLAFFDSFLKKRLSSVKDNINTLIKGRNFDDSTFIFVK